jgi:hypothetical protein
MWPQLISCARLLCSQGKSDARLCFIVVWFDPAASLERKYQLIYYASDGTIEMVRGPSWSTLDRSH